MKRLLILAVAAFSTLACSQLRDLRSDDQSYDNPFYAKYLNTGSTLDAQITQTLAGLRQNPDSAELHNSLGGLLIDKGFPHDAEREFERSVNANRKYYPAWYNLGLIRAANGNSIGARRAFKETVDLKPGHSHALFQLGLAEERNHHSDRAIRLYAKAFAINPALMRVDVNPRILDSKLTHIALIQMYPKEHSRRSMQLQGVPSTYTVPASSGTSTPPTTPSPQAAPQNIVTPGAPATQIGAEPSPLNAPATANPRRRGRLPRPTADPANTPVPTPPPATTPPATPPGS